MSSKNPEENNISNDPVSKNHEKNVESSKKPIDPKQKLDKYQDSHRMSYIERALYQYIKNFIYGGYKILIQKKFRPFFFLVGSLIVGLMAVIIIHISTGIIDANYIQILQIFTLCIALSFLCGALLGSISGKEKVINIITTILIFLSIGATYLFYIYEVDYEEKSFQIIKLVFLLLYILISTVSIFFIICSFHSSLAYKVVSLGNSPNRLLFQAIIRLVGWITLIIFVYFLTEGTRDSFVIGVAGIISSLILLVMFYSYDYISKDDSFEVKDNHQAKMNFRQILGFFNFYLIYQLSQSFASGGNIRNIYMDFLFLALNIFFLTNSFTRKAENIEHFDGQEKTHFEFQVKNKFLKNYRDRLGEKGLIFIALSVALGYQIVLVDSFMGSPIAILSQMTSDQVELNVLVHRWILLVGIGLVVISIVLFKVSPGFREITKNRYTMGHAMRMFKDMVVQKWDDAVKPIGEAFEKGKVKMDELKGQWNNWINRNKK